MKNKIFAKKYIVPALMLLACGMIAAGILNGDFNSVANKAAHICMECIGLG